MWFGSKDNCNLYTNHCSMLQPTWHAGLHAASLLQEFDRTQKHRFEISSQVCTVGLKFFATLNEWHSTFNLDCTPSKQGKKRNNIESIMDKSQHSIISFSIKFVYTELWINKIPK